MVVIDWWQLYIDVLKLAPWKENKGLDDQGFGNSCKWNLGDR